MKENETAVPSFLKESTQEGFSLRTTIFGVAGLMGLLTFGVVVKKLFF
jgi:hypothetical protein